MLAGTFKSNQNYVLLILLLVAPSLWGLSVYQQVDHGTAQAMPLYRALEGLISGIGWLPALFGMLLTLLIATIGTALFNSIELFGRRDFLIAILYVVLVSVADYQNSLDPVLCATPFLIIAIQRTINLSESKKRIRVMFNTGLVLGIAGMFYLPALLFVIPTSITAQILGRTQWREHFALAFGAAIWFIILFLAEQAFAVDLVTGSWRSVSAPRNGFVYLGLIVVALMLIIAIPTISAIYTRSIMRIKNFKAGIAGFMFLFIVLGLLEIAFGRPCGFTLLAFPIAFYSSYFFRHGRYAILQETAFVILLASAFWMQWSFLST